MRLLFRLLAMIYFDKIEVKGKFNDDVSFYVSNHRNGVVDGLVILSVIRKKLNIVIGKNLTRNRFTKFFFRRHIKIFRFPTKLAEMRHNKKELSRVNQEISKGTSVLMFPEGKSNIGDGLLDIKEGVAHVVTSLNERKIVPIGLHYEKEWSFRSRVFVHIGEPVVLSGDDRKEITEEIKNQLESVYDNDFQFTKQKNPFMAICLLPIILLFYISNLFVLTVPYFIANKFADEKNVIALWRIVVAVPTFIIQMVIYIGLSIFKPILLIVYLLITLLGLFTYRTWKNAVGLS